MNLTTNCSGFEPEIIPAAMLAHRVMGIMAHWREYMGEYSRMCPSSDGFILTNAVSRGKLFRPSHIYTGKITVASDLAAKI